MFDVVSIFFKTSTFQPFMNLTVLSIVCCIRRPIAVRTANSIKCHDLMTMTWMDGWMDGWMFDVAAVAASEE
jgi:hypothetical protein